MSLFTDASIEAACVAVHANARRRGLCDHNPAEARGLDSDAVAALDAAVAALDTDTLIEKAAKAIDTCEWNAIAEHHGPNDEELARAVLTAIGLLPEEAA